MRSAEEGEGGGMEDLPADVPRDAAIVTRDLQRDYPMGGEVVRALRGIDVVIGRNEFVAVMGPSGSGKSTLMNLIGCLDTPTAGEYWLGGRRVSSLEEDELARIRNREIGFVFQIFNLLPRATALQNVELPLVYAGRPKPERRALAETALARNRPRILLADEPTGNLDSQTSGEILGVFEELHRDGQTLILVTHEPDVARRAERRIQLRDGRVESDVRSERSP
jgi:putative ABC transport system ATP-binding protein